MTSKQINNKIKKFSLEIIKGEGYHYFSDITSKNQIGSSVHVSYLKDLSLEQWVEAAENARREHDEMYHDYV